MLNASDLCNKHKVTSKKMFTLNQKASNTFVLKAWFSSGEYRGRTDDLLHAMRFGHPSRLVFTNFYHLLISHLCVFRKFAYPLLGEINTHQSEIHRF